MIKVKEFWDFDEKPIDDKINNFLANRNRTFIDVKYQICSRVGSYATALLVYREDKK